MINFNKIENSNEALKEIFFGLDCFDGQKFESSLERLQDFHNKGNPLKIVYTVDKENMLNIFKEKLALKAPGITVSYEPVVQDVYDKLENRYQSKQKDV